MQIVPARVYMSQLPKKVVLSLAIRVQFCFVACVLLACSNYFAHTLYCPEASRVRIVLAASTSWQGVAAFFAFLFLDETNRVIPKKYVPRDPHIVLLFILTADVAIYLVEIGVFCFQPCVALRRPLGAKLIESSIFLACYAEIYRGIRDHYDAARREHDRLNV